MNKDRRRKRHIPERTCVACHTKRPKRDLVRVVRTTEGAVVIDERQKRNGRGAYLCTRRSCWEYALRRGTLGHALNVELTDEDTSKLRAFIQVLPSESERATSEN